VPNIGHTKTRVRTRAHTHALPNMTFAEAQRGDDVIKKGVGC
jgi:hypothetical protein